ncbi:MAG: DNA repair protein RadA [Fibrobacter sp.]|nr:DNA repair protein RadA [Fibrobacter sp.]
MNKKSKTAYVCSSCGQDYSKWRGKCDNCGAWDTITEMRISSGGPRSSSPQTVSQPRPLSECKSGDTERTKSGFDEIDRVLGGGLVKGAFILIGGDPGIGKSTLLLQFASRLSFTGKKVMYVTGEESPEQVSMRARRLGCGDSPVQVVTETAVESVLSVLGEHHPEVVVIDSIQTIFTEELESAPGSVAQVRDSAAKLLRYAKENGTVFFLIGHVTKDGSIAGPRILEHMVDTVLYFEGDSVYQYRMLRAVKNRFGPSGEIALLSMSDSGLSEVSNASEFFLTNRHNPQVGTSVVPVLEGSRVLVVELQALVNKSHFGLPQRVASGINPRKLSLLLAVIERHGGILLGDHDIFFNVAGGLTVSEPAADLGICAAVLSSFRNKPIRQDIAFIGELGLGGEVRMVSNMQSRIKETAHLGFKECIVPPPGKKSDWFSTSCGIKLTPCRRIGDIQEFIF